ncbi:helix-turn-helix domain-containing protein [Nocardia sp. NPDC050193]
MRQVIHDFNERGFDALDPKWSRGRPSKVDRATRERIACIARCCPRDLGRPFSTWSLTKLRDILATSKMNRILDLYDHPPTDGRVIGRIEARLGVALFDRDTRGTRPTTAGLEYVRLARQALTSVAAVSDSALRAAGIRRYRVGTFTGLSVPVFTALHRLLPPDTAVEQRIDNGRRLLRMIDDGELDAAVVIAPHTIWAPAAAEVTGLGSDPLLLITPPSTTPIDLRPGNRSSWTTPLWLASYRSQPEDVAHDSAARGARVHVAGSAPIALAVPPEVVSNSLKSNYHTSFGPLGT